jgi:hypothetical protein
MPVLCITRTDLTAEQLRAAAVRKTNAKVARRILAIAMVLAGYTREAAAVSQAMDRQTLRDWVIRYNQFGIEGLADRPRSGPGLVPELLALEWLPPIISRANMKHRLTLGSLTMAKPLKSPASRMPGRCESLPAPTLRSRRP